MKTAKQMADDIEIILSKPDELVLDGDGDIVLAASKAEWELIIDALNCYKQ